MGSFWCIFIELCVLCPYIVYNIPFSEVNCFSGMRNMAACKTVGSERPFVLNAYIDRTYILPGCRLDTAKRATGDVKLALTSYIDDDRTEA